MATNTIAVATVTTSIVIIAMTTIMVVVVTGVPMEVKQIAIATLIMASRFGECGGFTMAIR